MPQGRKLKLHLYLEGLHFTVIQVTVYGEANRPARATINIVAASAIETIQPRTHVFVFYEEFSDGVNADIPFQDRLKLLFEGEVMGVKWQISAHGSVSASITASDLSDYFTRIPAYFFRNNYSDLYAVQNMAFLLTPDATAVQSFLAGPGRDGITPSIRQFLLEGRPESLPEAFRQIYNDTAALNPFFRAANARLRLVDFGISGLRFFGFDVPQIGGRIGLKTDPDAVLLYSPTLEDLATHIIQNQDIAIPLQEIMARLMEIVRYQFWPQLCPSFEHDEFLNAKRLNNFILKPATFFLIPPRFNVIFPNMHSHVEMDRNFMQEPTRLRMMFINQTVKGLPIRAAYYAPKALEPLIEAVYGERSGELRRVASRENRDLGAEIKEAPAVAVARAGANVQLDVVTIADDPGNSPTRMIRGLLRATPGGPVSPESDETVKGIIPVDIREPVSVLIRAARESDANTFFTQIAEFELFLAQHAPRVASIQSDFNPNLALGFPALVLLESVGPKFGEIASISHTIDNNGGGSTTIQLSYVHSETVMSVDGRPASVKSRVMPPWINKAFQPQHVDAEAFSAPRIDPEHPDAPIPTERGRGAWRHFFGASGQAFWTDMPARTSGTLQATIINPTSPKIDFDKKIAAQALLSFYKGLDPDSHLAFSEGFTRRRIASLADVASFLGFTIGSGEEPDLESDIVFRADVRAAILALRNATSSPVLQV